MQGTGKYEILEGGSVVSSGKISLLDSTPDLSEADFEEKSKYELSVGDIYKELRLRGYDYGPSFQGIVNSDITGRYNKLAHNVTMKVVNYYMKTICQVAYSYRLNLQYATKEN